MNHELVEILRSVLKEELQGIDQRFNQIDEHFVQIDQRFGQMDQHFKQMNQNFDRLELAQENMLREIRSSTKYIVESIKDHRVVIDLIQSDTKPKIN